MKIGYMCPYGMLSCGESEARLRFIHCLEKRGHTVIPLDEENYYQGVYAEKLGLDFIISHENIRPSNSVMPDIFSVFLFWAPTPHYCFSDTWQNIVNMDRHDCVAGGYESPYALLDVQSNPSFPYEKLLFVGASVPKDFVQPVKMRDSYKLFYVGVLPRYKSLLKRLDETNLVELYGPREVFGRKTWEDCKSYKGELPFDGKTIISAMSQAGVVLAIHSTVHNQQQFVSNRIFEAAAAGAVIIADDNAFIRRHFGDSVFYVDIQKSEEEVSNQIQAHFDYIVSHPQQAYEMAKRAQEIFLKELTLDKQIDDLLDFVQRERQTPQQLAQKQGPVDVICAVKSVEEFEHIKTQLQRQSYPAWRLIVLCPESLAVRLQDKTFCTTRFVKTEQGLCGTTFKRLEVTSPYFCFIDAHTLWHQNHLYKLVNVLCNTPEPFAYSGTYLKKDGKYQLVWRYPQNSEHVRANMLDLASRCGVITQLLNQVYLGAVLFRKQILQEVTPEVSQMTTDQIHLYLMLKAWLKNPADNRFVFAATSGRDCPPVLTALTNTAGERTACVLVDVVKIFLKYPALQPQLFRLTGENTGRMAVLNQYLGRILKHYLKLRISMCRLQLLFASKKRRKRVQERISNLKRDLSCI